MTDQKAAERKLAQDVYIRVCKDSGFQLDLFTAVHLAAGALGISSMELWVRMGIDLAVMEQIALGKHPACCPAVETLVDSDQVTKET